MLRNKKLLIGLILLRGLTASYSYAQTSMLTTKRDSLHAKISTINKDQAQKIQKIMLVHQQAAFILMHDTLLTDKEKHVRYRELMKQRQIQIDSITGYKRTYKWKPINKPGKQV